MNAFSSADMAAVTRLTRAGKLSEAMALLQGRGTPADTLSDNQAATTADHSGPTLDMAAPVGSGGPWTMSEPSAARSDGAQTTASAALRGLASAFVSRIRSADAGSINALGENPLGFRPTPPPLPHGARFEERSFANDAGCRAYKIFVPSGYTGQPLPVVVMLHGCTQSPDDFAAGTRMNELAERQTVLVAYPAQPQSANAQRCWNWFNVGDQHRDAGEPALIAGIARQVVAEFSADARRVYVAGLSAGGAAAAIMAKAYPDVFAAVGVHSGLACGAARDMPSAFAAMQRGGTAGRGGARPSVPTIVFHGDGDRTVNPVNGDQVIAQARPEATLRRTVTQGEANGLAFTCIVETDETGRAILEQWVLHGAGHAWSGGSPNGSYADPRGPDASREMVRFFLSHARA